MCGTRVRRCLAVLLFIFVGNSFAGTNQWTGSGPDGGLIQDVVYDPITPNVAYAAATLGLYKSTDGGINWTVLKDDFGSYTLADIALDPTNHNRLYVAALDGGVFRSNDAGATFARISPILTDANIDGPQTLVVSADGTTLYYSTISGRFFRSVDSGQSWSERTALASGARNIFLKPGDSQSIYAQGNKIYKSINGGGSWTETSPVSYSLSSFVLVPGTPNALWVTAGSNVYVSTTDGASWTLSLNASPVGLTAIELDPNTANSFVVAPMSRDDTCFQYSGGTWTARAGKMQSTNRIAIAPGNSSVILAATNNGLLRTSNLGTTWSTSQTGIHETSNRVMTTSGTRTYAGHENISLAYSANGVTWQDIPTASITIGPNPYLDSLAVHPTNPSTLFIGIQQSGLFRSLDGGVIWTPVTSLPAASRIFSIVFEPSNANTMYVVAASLVFPPTPLAAVHKSIDGGVSFTPLSTTGLPNPLPGKLIVDPQNTSRLFLGAGIDSGTRGLYRSTDGGVAWTNVIGNVHVFDFALDPADSRRIYAAAEFGLMISTDSGTTWNTLSSQTATNGPPYLFAVDPTLSSNLFAISPQYLNNMSGAFVMRSVDSGLSWERIPSQSLPNWVPIQISINPNNPTTLNLGIAARGVQSLEIAPDLGVSIVGHNGVKPLGVNSSFSVLVQNSGAFSASGLNLAVQVPANLQNVSASIERGTCTVSSGSIACAIPYVRRDEIVTALVSYRPVNGGPVNVNVTTSAHERDPALANNSAAATATVTELVDLQLSGSASPTSVTIGDNATYSFQLLNAGPSTSSATRITIQFPSGVTLGTISPSGCVATNQSVDCNLGALNAAGSVTITANVTANTTGTLQATASAASANTSIDTNTANNVVTATLTSNVRPIAGGGGGGGGALPMNLILLLLVGSLKRISHRRIAISARMLS